MMCLLLHRPSWINTTIIVWACFYLLALGLVKMTSQS